MYVYLEIQNKVIARGRNSGEVVNPPGKTSKFICFMLECNASGRWGGNTPYKLEK